MPKFYVPFLLPRIAVQLSLRAFFLEVSCPFWYPSPPCLNSDKTIGSVLVAGHGRVLFENRVGNALVIFKAQLGEPFLEILIFFFSAKPPIKTPKPALSAQIGTSKKNKQSRHFSETGT